MRAQAPGARAGEPPHYIRTAGGDIARSFRHNAAMGKNMSAHAPDIGADDAHPRRMRALMAIWVMCALGALASLGWQAPSAGAVTGGSPANPDAWPWLVALMDPAQADPFQAQFCAASRVGVGWYLTAAHCVEDQGRFMRPGEVEIGAGSAVLSQISERIPVVAIYPYPGRRPAGAPPDRMTSRCCAPMTPSPRAPRPSG